MVMPMSAFFIAGAEFVPSATIATVLPISCNVSTMPYIVAGAALATTLTFVKSSSNSGLVFSLIDNPSVA